MNNSNNMGSFKMSWRLAIKIFLSFLWRQLLMIALLWVILISFVSTMCVIATATLNLTVERVREPINIISFVLSSVCAVSIMAAAMREAVSRHAKQIVAEIEIAAGGNTLPPNPCAPPSDGPK